MAVHLCAFATMLVLIAMPACAAPGASAAVAASPAPDPSIAVTAQPSSPPQSRAEVLQAEVQVLKEFTQHILSTVYFALGTVVVVLIALAGYNWYQNQRTYERERDALREHLSRVIAEDLGKARSELRGALDQRLIAYDATTRKSFEHFDAKMAEVFGLAMKRLAEVNLTLKTSIHRTTHSAPTPRTDLMQLIHSIEESLARVDDAVLKHAVSEVIRTLEENPGLKNYYRTALLELAAKLPADCSAHADQLRSFVAPPA